MANRYWVGGSGVWNDTNHWSTTSGGSGGASEPSVFDDVFINSASSAGAFIITHPGFSSGTNPVRARNLSLQPSFPFQFSASASWSLTQINLGGALTGNSNVDYRDAVSSQPVYFLQVAGTTTLNLGLSC